MLTTNQKGFIAESAIALEAAKLGIGVYRPLTDERYDFVFDVRPSFFGFSASGRHGTTT